VQESPHLDPWMRCLLLCLCHRQTSG